MPGDQFRRVFANSVGIGNAPTGIDADVAAVDPAQLRELLQECRHAGLKLWIVRGARHQHPDAPHSLLLRACRERPRRCRAAEQRDELAPALHVWMAPAWQEIIWRAAQRSLAVMCPACWCSPGGPLALMGSANRVLIIRTGSMSR